MTLEEFLLKLNKLDISVYEAKEGSYRTSYELRSRRKKQSFSISSEDYIINKWRTGGVSGGSCWDTSENARHYPKSGDPEPEFVEFDIILENLCPEIPYLKYKKLLSIITLSEMSEDEYYGNSTNYAIKVIKLSDLYNKLKELNIL